jgi:hypothetical protein
MIYSVWNQGRGVYDYYQTPEVQETANAPRPKHLRATQLGMTPAQAAWPLPSGATKIGSGEFARGRVASTAGQRGALGGFGVESLFNPKFVGIAIVAWFLWKRSRRS